MIKNVKIPEERKGVLKGCMKDLEKKKRGTEEMQIHRTIPFPADNRILLVYL